ncbi:DUF6174 domain-containing protein [Flavobacteriaceae bacterium]|nr:DUF6174 domain-containing protein [Flavobacteriaceae bacterium]
MQISCYCMSEYTFPKAIVVKNNQIQSVDGVAYADSEFGTFMTIDEFFEYIKNQRLENPIVESLEFDSMYGFPTYIYFDISEMIADEEIGYTLTDFIPNR